MDKNLKQRYIFILRKHASHAYKCNEMLDKSIGRKFQKVIYIWNYVPNVNNFFKKLKAHFVRLFYIVSRRVNKEYRVASRYIKMAKFQRKFAQIGKIFIFVSVP